MEFRTEVGPFLLWVTELKLERHLFKEKLRSLFFSTLYHVHLQSQLGSKWEEVWEMRMTIIYEIDAMPIPFHSFLTLGLFTYSIYTLAFSSFLSLRPLEVLCVKKPSCHFVNFGFGFGMKLNYLCCFKKGHDGWLFYISFPFFLLSSAKLLESPFNFLLEGFQTNLKLSYCNVT